MLGAPAELQQHGGSVCLVQEWMNLEKQTFAEKDGEEKNA